SISAPRAVVLVQCAGATARKPSRTVSISSPGWAARITATRPPAPAHAPGGHPFDLPGGAGPVAELGLGCVRVRADDRDGTGGAGTRGAPVRARGQAAGQRQGAVVAQ